MFYKTDVLEDFAKHKKTSVPESCFNKVADLLKETPVQMFSSKFCKIFKNVYFIEHFRATAFAF